MDSSKYNSDIPLGKVVPYSSHYDPTLLFKIARPVRNEFFSKFGYDRWVCYEFTWLNPSGCPCVCLLEIIIPASSPFIIESKSLKLYLGSFSQERYTDSIVVSEVIQKDLRSILECEDLTVKTLAVSDLASLQIRSPLGTSIDQDSISISQYNQPSKELLEIESAITSETLHSDLFRSLCPVTSQPDFATIVIEYRGLKIKPDSLLKYLVSYRNHSGFHETCCEAVFEDISSACKPEKLTVTCFFNRRGGIDINPVRSNHAELQPWLVRRCARQ